MADCQSASDQKVCQGYLTVTVSETYPSQVDFFIKIFSRQLVFFQTEISAFFSLACTIDQMAISIHA